MLPMLFLLNCVPYMKSVKRICAFIAGFVLFGAGLLKLMDPVGASLVVGEYFSFFHLGFLTSLSKVAAVLFALLETVVGLALLTGISPRVTSLVSGVLLLFFTLLTLILWIKNPPMDCGCFGEAIHLTHFQSFIKNVVLCALWAVAFLPLKSVWKPPRVKTASFAIALVSVIAFTVYSLMNVPAMDFTPFKPGATLMQAQLTPSADSPLLSICSQDGEYCDELLATGHKLLLTAYDPEDLSELSTISRREFGEALRAAGTAELLFVAAGEFPGAEGAYTADRRTLMSLNRSNGGATLISNGVVVAKWPARSLPELSKIECLVSLDPASAVAQENTPRRLKLQGFLLYLFAVVLLI